MKSYVSGPFNRWIALVGSFGLSLASGKFMCLKNEMLLDKQHRMYWSSQGMVAQSADGNPRHKGKNHRAFDLSPPCTLTGISRTNDDGD
jgi:hypothetical protein